MISMKKRLCIAATSATLLLPIAANAYGPAGTPDDWPAPMKHRLYGKFLIDRLEASYADEQDGYVWDVMAWYGGDKNRLWLKSEGEGLKGESPEDSEVQLLYGRLIAPFWDLQIGVRYDFQPTPNRTHGVLSLQGVVPYEFESDTALFVSEEGDVTLRSEFEYDLRFTQRLILQPRFELNASFSEDNETGLRRGINSTQLGVRLRYEITRKFSPYIGVSWNKKYAATADIAREEGEPTDMASLVAGIRAWF